MDEGNPPPSILDQILDLITSGKSLAAAGAPFGLAREDVRALLREHDVPMKSLGKRQQDAAREIDLVEMQRQLTEARAELAEARSEIARLMELVEHLKRGSDIPKT